MDRLSFYRKNIQKVLTEYYEIAAQTPEPDGIESVLAFDEQRDHYFWLQIGWDEDGRVRGMTVYLRIKDDKIHIEQDLTEEGMATELLKEGVPPEDIVLAFQPPAMRKYTEFAVA
ncbi:MAG: XisI protein [Spirulina sp. SIO3F2]|nr:XisI protein [Spirulina sp. SIO3F2]